MHKKAPIQHLGGNWGSLNDDSDEDMDEVDEDEDPNAIQHMMDEARRIVDQEMVDYTPAEGVTNVGIDRFNKHQEIYQQAMLAINKKKKKKKSKQQI